MRPVSRGVILVSVYYCTVLHRTLSNITSPSHACCTLVCPLLSINSATLQQYWYVSLTHGCSVRGMVSYDSVEKKDAGYCVPRCRTTYLAKAVHPESVLNLRFSRLQQPHFTFAFVALQFQYFFYRHPSRSPPPPPRRLPPSALTLVELT